MRRLLALVTCSFLAASSGACEKKVIVREVPAAAADAGAGTSGGGPTTPANDPLVIELPGISSDTDVPFEVPKGALGFNVIIEGTADDLVTKKLQYGIQRLTDPTGKVVHDDFTPSGGVVQTSLAEFDTIAAAAIPQGEGTSATPGTWKLRVGLKDCSATKVKVNARIRIQSTSDGTFHGGKLTLHVHLPDGLNVDGTTMTSEQAESAAGIKERVDGYFTLLAKHTGIERGAVVFHAAAVGLAEVENADELFDAFSSSTGTPDGTQAFHILYTNLISIADATGGGITARGLAPGIPGAASVFGRPVSTIVVALSNSPGYDSLAMLHEMGHFFGLNHTTEYGNGGESDPLTDTPRCTDLPNGPSAAQLAACPDRLNIMFPSPTTNANSATISPTQKRVYQGSPIYLAYASGTLKTQSYESPFELGDPDAISFALTRRSGAPLSAFETELAGGICGLVRADPGPLVARYGEAATIRDLEAARVDDQLDTLVRTRATQLLRALGR